MKNWTVTYTNDGVNYDSLNIEGTTYTDAYCNFMVKYPEEMITELTEVKEDDSN